MSLEIHEVNAEIVGKRLGQKLYSSRGRLLLGMGAEIGSFHYQHIKETGYRSIYILTNHCEVLDSAGHIISDKLRASAPIMLREIYRKLQSNNKIEVSNGKKELSALADTLIQEVNIKMPSPPDIVDLKRQEDYLYQHAIDVAAYSILLGQSMQYHQLKLFDLAISALLCDFGMISVDKEILYKPAALDEAEFEKVKQHTIQGFQHLGRHCYFKGMVTIVALQHHERWDGTGYPNGLSGEDIHEYSQIVALADFFDAYTSDRPYRRLHTIQEALAYIEENAGQQFSPRVVKHFLGFFNV
ncbi:MAG: HD-GYP domain-containing protein [Calditrichaeota bacterium]|nr:MAG: HD-GYP domain-containing protein [Calditrichota bacterium]